MQRSIFWPKNLISSPLPKFSDLISSLFLRQHLTMCGNISQHSTMSVDEPTHNNIRNAIIGPICNGFCVLRPHCQILMLIHSADICMLVWPEKQIPQIKCSKITILRCFTSMALTNTIENYYYLIKTLIQYVGD